MTVGDSISSFNKRGRYLDNGMIDVVVGRDVEIQAFLSRRKNQKHSGRKTEKLQKTDPANVAC